MGKVMHGNGHIRLSAYENRLQIPLQNGHIVDLYPIIPAEIIQIVNEHPGSMAAGVEHYKRSGIVGNGHNKLLLLRKPPNLVLAQRVELHRLRISNFLPRTRASIEKHQ